MNTSKANPVTIVMIEDDEGHARLIERNIRRAGVTNDIVPMASGHDALEYLLGGDRSGIGLMGDTMFVDFAEEFEGIGLESAAVEFLESLQGLAGEGFGKIEVF